MNLTNYELYTNELTAILVFGFIMSKYFFLLQKAVETEHLYNILYNTLILVAVFCVMLQTQERAYGWKPRTVSNMRLIGAYQRQISKIPLWRRKRGKVGCFKINWVKEEVITL